MAAPRRVVTSKSRVTSLEKAAVTEEVSREVSQLLYSNDHRAKARVRALAMPTKILHPYYLPSKMQFKAHVALWQRPSNRRVSEDEKGRFEKPLFWARASCALRAKSGADLN